MTHTRGVACFDEHVVAESCCAQHVEELVAEFGAAFLCGFAGLHHAAREAQQASYSEGWSQVLKKDHRLIVRAASAAQRAADYIRGKTVATDELAVAA